jgi:DNA polymerase III delta subunit
LYLDTSEIEDLVKDYEKDTKAIKDELLKLCWFMRGSLSYTEAHLLTVEEREAIAKLVAENLETTKTTQMPFF